MRGERGDWLPRPWPWSLVATRSTPAAGGLQSNPHPGLSPWEREPVVSGATAFTLATVSRGDSFDSSGRGAAIEPSPQPSPLGEGASGDANPSRSAPLLSTGLVENPPSAHRIWMRRKCGDPELRLSRMRDNLVV